MGLDAYAGFMNDEAHPNEKGQNEIARAVFQAITGELARDLMGNLNPTFAAINDTVRDLGATTVFTVSQAAGAFGLLSQAGFDAGEAINLPALVGMSVDDELRIIYSPYDLEAGWLNTYFPLMRGYDNASAQQLGMNIITYAMTR